MSAKLCEAIKKFKPINKNGINPFFKSPNNPQGSSYAKLDDIQKAILPALTEHGIVITSTIENEVLKTSAVSDGTVLLQVASPIYIDKNKSPMQSLGAAITYATRFNLQMMFCLDCESDDDGNSLVKEEPKKAVSQKTIPNKAETLGFKVSKEHFDKVISAASKMDIKQPELMKLIQEKYNVKGGSQLNQEQFRDLCSFVGVTI